MPAAVPAHTATIIVEKRLSSATKLGPAANCHTFVTSEGTTSSAAAWTGGMTRASRPIATVGKPIPMTPLTMPASRKVQAMIEIVAAGSCICQRSQ